jgi:polysaccharide pyruvyl transferase CsaB
MGSKIKIVLSGYYGYDNSGDEAVLVSILNALEGQARQKGMEIEPIVLSGNPQKTAKIYGVRTAHRMRPKEMLSAIRESDGLISGGGSLLQDATGLKTIPYYLAVIQAAHWFGKPAFIYSQGIGPVHRRIFYPLIRNIIGRCQYISARDPASASLLGEMGIPMEKIEVVPDPVMGMTTEPDGIPEEGPRNFVEGENVPVIGVSVRFWNKDYSDLNHISHALKLVMESRDVGVKLLPFHDPHDVHASEYVLKRIMEVSGAEARDTKEQYGAKVQIAKPTDGSPSEMMKQVGMCDVLIGMRLHSLIYAAAQYVPPIGISYDPKIDQFLKQLDMEPVGSVQNLDPQRLAEEICLLMDKKAEWIQNKGGIIRNLRKKSQQPAQQILDYLRIKG